MYLLSSSVAAACLLGAQQVIAAPTELGARDLNSFIASERIFALQGVLNNIGPDGADVPGAGAGFVVASPSKVDPDCQFDSSRIRVHVP
jgi:glucoamylase